MSPSRTRILVVTALCAGLMSQAGFSAPDALAASTANESPPDEIIVRAKALEKLRLEIKRSEEAVYARFNDINSTDLYDIHCYERKRSMSHIEETVCLSNAWRQSDQAIAQGTIGGIQAGGGGAAASTTGGATAFAQASRANQLATEQRIKKEMADLAHSDPALQAAVLHLGEAYLAEERMTGLKAFHTVDAEVAAGDKGLPFDAQRLFEVRIGLVPWVHMLTSPTFTLAGVEGRIRDLRLDCGKTRHKLKYREDVDWTIPDVWGECTLYVKAKRETTFALYEFD